MKIIVVIREGADREAFKSFLAAESLAFTEFDCLPRIFEVEVGDTPSIVMAHADAEVYDESDAPFQIAGSFPNGTQQSLYFQGDPGASTAYNYTDNWALHRMVRQAGGAITALPAASTFNCYRSGVGVDVYVVDTGVDPAHPDLVGRATQVYSAISGSTVDDNGHGTECSTLAAGTKFGPAKDALVWGFKGLNSVGMATTGSLTSAVNAALSHYQGRAALNRPAVLNMSWGSTGSDTYGSVVASAIAAGIVCCAAAMNSNQDVMTGPSYPAADANVICVGASTINDGFGYVVGSNFGSRVDVLAPSELTRSGWVNGTCHTSGATSAACGVVTGVVACMLQGYARLTTTAQVQAVRSYLMAQATPVTISGALPPNTTNKVVYLDPSPTPALIAGLTPMVTPNPSGYSCKGVCPVLGLVIPAASVERQLTHAPGVSYPPAVGVANSSRATVVT